MNARRSAALLAAIWLALAVPTSTVSACSPIFNPTIRALGPAQVVVIGTIGERVPGGRLFHVERWFNGGVPGTPIVIAFKEGEATGDCSYPVATGERKIIAPYREQDGRLSADLATIQGDPDTPEGRRWVDEAEALFGPGVVPPPVEPEPGAGSAPPIDPAPATDAGILTLVVVAAAVLALAAAVFGVVTRRRV